MVVAKVDWLLLSNGKVLLSDNTFLHVAVGAPTYPGESTVDLSAQIIFCFFYAHHSKMSTT
jgi:hypothetical protein